MKQKQTNIFSNSIGPRKEGKEMPQKEKIQKEASSKSINLFVGEIAKRIEGIVVPEGLQPRQKREIVIDQVVAKVDNKFSNREVYDLAISTANKYFNKGLHSGIVAGIVSSLKIIRSYKLLDKDDISKILGQNKILDRIIQEANAYVKKSLKSKKRRSTK